MEEVAMKYPNLENKLRDKFSSKAVTILVENYPKYCALLEKDLKHGPLCKVLEDILYELLEELDWKLAEDK